MRAVPVALILIASAVLGQEPRPAPGREAASAFLAQRNRLRDEAKSAFNREMAREQAGQCQKANSTRDNVACVNTETGNTQANFDAYVSATRALLALKYPSESAPADGPTGTPLTSEQQRQRFDKVEEAWQDYSKAACDAAYDLYKGGSIAPVVEIGCQQRLLRSHLRELEALYGDYFSR